MDMYTIAWYLHQHPISPNIRRMMHFTLTICIALLTVNPRPTWDARQP